jgi:hypothetical protein
MTLKQLFRQIDLMVIPWISNFARERTG